MTDEFGIPAQRKQIGWIFFGQTTILGVRPNTFLLLGIMSGLSNILKALFVLLCFVSCAQAEIAVRDVEPVNVVLFMFFGIGVGIVFMQVLNKLGDPIPYTVVVFIAGILFSLANKEGTGVFGESIAMWINIDAEVLLFVFLPPLIFGEAMSLNWYHAKTALLQSMMLAGPGVLLGAALMGCFVKGVLPRWSWELSMTMGAITSATDPVAVVALLKSAGASPKLTMIIVGESLLNDGTAMVLFEVFYNLLKGETYTAGGIFLFFFNACVGSVVVGVLIGLVCIRWMRTANRPLSDMDVLVQTAITICCAYVTFFVAQKTLELSGVLACCGAGMMFAWLAPPLILNHDTLHNIWGMIEWSLNTMIFLLAGLIIGYRFHLVQGFDWFLLIVLYIFLMLIRVLVIAVCFPVVSKVGHKCTREEAVFMAWGGLRGALGMALALICYRDGPKQLESETSRMLFYIGGIAAITLVVNATTSRSLLFKLGLLGEVSAEKTIVMASIQKKMKKHMKKALQDLAIEFHFNEKEIEEVRISISLLKETNVKDIMGAVEQAKVEKEAKVQRKMSMKMDNYQYNPHAPPIPEDSVLADGPIDIQHIPTRKFSYDPRHNAKLVGDGASYGMVSMLDADTQLDGSGGKATNKSEGFDVIEALEAGRGRPTARSRGSSNADVMNRRLSMCSRGPNASISPQLLAYVRSTFLSMVRVHYWHDIEQGKLPRKSKSGKFLLYSIEVALDEVTMDAGGRDWTCIEKKLDSIPLNIQLLTKYELYFPESLFNAYPSRLLNMIECQREERMVYILTSFIHAHENAQEKIHGYLRLEEEDDMQQSPEELKVISESKLAVTIARRRLDNINPETLRAIKTKQAAALMLTKQADMVKEMVQEGLLTSKDAEEIIESINTDMAGVNRKRNMMYREHGDSSSRRRKELRKLGEIPTAGLLENVDSL